MEGATPQTRLPTSKMKMAARKTHSEKIDEERMLIKGLYIDDEWVRRTGGEERQELGVEQTEARETHKEAVRLQTGG